MHLQHLESIWKWKRVVVLGLASAALLFQAQGAPAADTWPGFRGPDALGVGSGSTLSAQQGAVGLTVAWRVPLGSGYSGIAVAGDTVVTMFSDGTQDVVAAFDRARGGQRWRFPLGPTYEGHDGSHTGPIATPLIDAGRVFCLSAQGRLVALSFEEGKEIWSSDLVADHGAKSPWYGFTASPIVAQGVLVVPIGAPEAAVIGLDPATGAKRWSAGADVIQYQSPINYPNGGDPAVLVVGDKELHAIAAGSGDTLWSYAHGGSGTRGVASMVPVPIGDDRLFLALHDDRSALVNLQRRDKVVTATQTWEDRSIRNSYNVPVSLDGFLYAYSSRFLTCVDAKTGEARWRSRQPGDGFLVLVDGHLVIATKAGSVHVAKASPDGEKGYQEVAATPVFDDLIWAHPSYADNSIFVRSMSELARVDIISDRLTAAGGRKLVETSQPVAASSFARFITALDKAEDKPAAIDAFLGKQGRFPIVEGDRVHFVYRGPGKDLAVAGDLFGARQERAMTRVPGTDLFHYTAQIERDARFNYVFMKDYEELLDPRNPRVTTITVMGKDMEITFGRGEFEMNWFAMPDWRAPGYFETPDASRQGKLVKHELDSKVLEDKHTLEVYLPAGYEDSDERYPVAYLHNGGAAQKYGDMVRALDNLSGRAMAPTIVVFIQHVPRLFGPNKYPELITGEVIPFVDENYRTLAKPEGRASVGQGFAAFSAISYAIAADGQVGKVGCQSPFIFGSMGDALRAGMPTADELPLQLYWEWGKYDMRNPHENWDLADASRQFAKTLEEHGYTYTGGEVNDGTDFSSWRNRYDRLFGAMFPVKR